MIILIDDIFQNIHEKTPSGSRGRDLLRGYSTYGGFTFDDAIELILTPGQFTNYLSNDSSRTFKISKKKEEILFAIAHNYNSNNVYNKRTIAKVLEDYRNSKKNTP